MTIKKSDIIKSVRAEITLLEGLITALELLDSEEASTSRLATNRVALTMFEMINSITATEADIYNYMKGRN